MNSSGNNRTATMPSGHVHRERARNGQANESAIGLTTSAARALQLDAHLEPVFGRCDLDVPGPDPHARLDPRRHDLAFEEQLRETPVPPVLAHTHDDSARTPPYALT